MSSGDSKQGSGPCNHLASGPVLMGTGEGNVVSGLQASPSRDAWYMLDAWSE